MSLFRKSIFTAASPNTQLDDVLISLVALVSPWAWNNDKYNQKFAQAFSNYINIPYVSLIDSGRSALQIILKSQNIGQGSEVILPSFTCVVVANAVSYSGAKPVYLDTNKNDFNATYSRILEKVNENTKAIVVQHTFGKRVNIDEVREILRKVGRGDILIIEDFAHIIQSNINLKGDFGFTTFGIEKVMSTVRGGAIITHSKELNEFIAQSISDLPKYPTIQLIKSLLNPIFWYVAIPLHSVGYSRFTIGAFIRSIWRKMGFLGIMVESQENQAKKPDWFPAQMSPALSRLGLVQLKKLNKYNEHRLQITKIYHSYLNELSDTDLLDENRVYLRYPILLRNMEEFNKVWNLSRRLRVTLGNWFEKPLYGSTVDESTYQALCYVPAETPETMNKAGLTLNLPTSVNMGKVRARELAERIREII